MRNLARLEDVEIALSFWVRSSKRQVELDRLIGRAKGRGTCLAG